jgi:hypothetical protein
MPLSDYQKVIVRRANRWQPCWTSGTPAAARSVRHVRRTVDGSGATNRKGRGEWERACVDGEMPSTRASQASPGRVRGT